MAFSTTEHWVQTGNWHNFGAPLSGPAGHKKGAAGWRHLEFRRFTYVRRTRYASGPAEGLEVEVSGELKVARAVGDTADGAERGRALRPVRIGIAEDHVIGGVQGIRFEDELQVLVDGEGAAQARIQIPAAGVVEA